jgi:MFS transporter, MHS family, proline/betaine transporter
MQDRFISLLLVFFTFAIGFVARPIGAIIFGMIGDRKGKLYAVNLSIWLMAIPTTLIGLLPSYNKVGLLAPICLVSLRVLQGISAGGQFSGLIAIAADSNNKNRAFLVSLVHAISIIGCLIASVVSYLTIIIVNSLDLGHVLANFTWRIPFVISSILFIIYIKFRPKLDSHSFTYNKFSFMDILRKQPNELITMIIFGSCTGTVYYVLFSYIVTYLQLYVHLSKSTSFMIMNGVLLLSIILYPIFGYVARNYLCRVAQAQKLILYLLIAAGVFTGATFSPWFAVVGLVLMVIYFCAITAFVTSLFAEVFAINYRMTACSLSYNIGVTIAGFAPLIAEIFSSKLTNIGLPIFIGLVCMIMYISLMRIRLSKGYQALLSAAH